MGYSFTGKWIQNQPSLNMTSYPSSIRRIECVKEWHQQFLEKILIAYISREFRT
jgi:hypothetical protein